MSDLEHLMENALCIQEKGGDFELYKAYDHNRWMANRVNVRLEDIWEMAFYVINTWDKCRE